MGLGSPTLKCFIGRQMIWTLGFSRT